MYSKGDMAVGLTCLCAAAFLVGLELGEAKPVEITCPKQLQGERLVGVHHTGTETTCAYYRVHKANVLVRRKT